MDIEINIEENPHILMGRGLWATSIGDFRGTFSEAEDETHFGFLAFHPVINPVDVDHIDDAVNLDNLNDVSNPPMSLVFANVESIDRLISELSELADFIRGKND